MPVPRVRSLTPLHVCVCVLGVLQVLTVERWSGVYGVVGYACLPAFLDPNTREQPLSKNVADYVLNVVRWVSWLWWEVRAACITPPCTSNLVAV
jgi:hypothetical protein